MTTVVSKRASPLAGGGIYTGHFTPSQKWHPNCMMAEYKVDIDNYIMLSDMLRAHRRWAGKGRSSPLRDGSSPPP